MKGKFELPKFQSIYELLTFLISDDGKHVNRVKFDKGESDSSVMAELRMMTGETTKEESNGLGRLFSKKIVGMERPNLLLTVCRDTSSRNLKNGEFSYRTIPIASITDGLRVKEINILLNFSSEWIKVDLRGLSIFPHQASGELAGWFVKKMKELHYLRSKKTFLDNQLKNLKKKLGNTSVIEADGFRYFYEPPSGTSDAIVDEKLERVKTLQNVYPGRNLVGEFCDEKFKFEAYDKVSQIVDCHLKYKEACREFAACNEDIRPFELGLIEINAEKSTIVVNGVSFTVEKSDVKRYDYPKETIANLESGLWSYAPVPKTRGEWKCEPIVVPPANNVVEETKPVEV